MCIPGWTQSPEFADQYWEQALELHQDRKYVEAAQMYLQSAEAESKSSRPRQKELARAYGEAGSCFYLANDLESALQYYLKAFETAEKAHDTNTLLKYLNPLGDVYYDWGE